MFTIVLLIPSIAWLGTNSILIKHIFLVCLHLNVYQYCIYIYIIKLLIFNYIHVLGQFCVKHVGLVDL